MKDSIIILCGGGPAPGMNTVVCSVAKTFLAGGYRVIGLHGGYSGLFSQNPRTEDLDFFKADAYFNRGGSYLQMSRFKPTDKDFEENFNLSLFTENNIKLLVTVGGDDTASTANRIAKFLENKKYPIANIHVPKTIDNDLPLPNNAPTFGFNSAKDEGAHIARTVYEDARTSGNWLLISAMGRSAGHLALGIGEATHAPMTIIPEMFNKTNITIDKIVKLTLSAIIKRNILGIGYGTVVVAEGVFHDLADEDIKADVLFNQYRLQRDLEFYTVVIDDDGTCIVHPDGKNVPIKDKAVLKAMEQRKSGVFHMDVAGERSFIYYAPIAEIDWSVAVVVPANDAKQPVRYMCIALLVLVLVGSLVVWFVLGRYAKKS